MTRTIVITCLVGPLFGCATGALQKSIGGDAWQPMDCPVGQWRTTANSEAPIGDPGVSAYELGRPVYGDWNGVVPGVYQADGDPMALHLGLSADPWADVTAFVRVDPDDPDRGRCMVQITYDFSTAQAWSDDLRFSADVLYEVTCALNECGEVADAEITYPINAETRAPEGALGPTAVAVVQRYQGRITEAAGAFWVQHRAGERTWEEHLVDWVAAR